MMTRLQLVTERGVVVRRRGVVGVRAAHGALDEAAQPLRRARAHALVGALELARLEVLVYLPIDHRKLGNECENHPCEGCTARV